MKDDIGEALEPESMADADAVVAGAADAPALPAKTPRVSSAVAVAPARSMRG